MSLGIAFKGAEGIVLAVDSRVTLMAQTQVQGRALTTPAYFDNATKLLRVKGQNYAGVVTYGAGALGQTAPRTAQSYLPEFEATLRRGRLPIAELARRLGEFFSARWADAGMPSPPVAEPLVFLVGGYDADAPYGRVYQVSVPDQPEPVEQNAGDRSFGLTYGGQNQIAGRILTGVDPQTLNIARQALGLNDSQVNTLSEALRANLQSPIPYQFLPLQDCIDLAIYLIETTIAVQTWTVGIRGVGGRIDVATVTGADGFRSVQQKQIRGRFVERNDG